MSHPIDPTEIRCDGPAYGPWTDPRRRSRTAVVVLVVVLYLLVFDVLWRVVGMVTVGGLVKVPSDLWFERFDLVTTILGWVYLTSLAAAAATFIRWQRTMIRNLPFLGCERPEFGIGIASFGWFIPLVNLALPLICLR